MGWRSGEKMKAKVAQPEELPPNELLLFVFAPNSLCACAFHMPAAQQWFYDTLTRLHPYSSPSRCLTLPNSNTNKGQGLTLEECSATASNQRWTTSITIFPPAFNSQNSRLLSRLANPAQCIENLGYNTTNGAPVAMMPCNANATTNTNQRWRLNDTGLLQLTFNTAKCLEAGGAGANGEGGRGGKGWLCSGRG
jgi:hypothetical protein